MIAYNHLWLNNLFIQDEAESAYQEKFISKEERGAITKTYPVGFYTPNIFIRIGLFILTVVIASFSFGLLSLFFMNDLNTKTFGIFFLFIAMITYVLLEYMVTKKYHFKSGVDDSLLLMSGSCFVSGLNLLFNISSLGNSILIFIIALYLFLRFADMLMSAVSAVALLAVVFFAYIKFGSIAKATTPFLIMAISAIMYLIAKKSSQRIKFKYYINCITIVEIISLICFYLAGNYYVVREASIAMFGLNLKPGESIPFGWLFWIFTIAVPCLYILRGIQKKDVVLIRVGLILVAAIVFTVRYYHTIFPVETLMTLSGILLITISYALIKYLKVSRHGFTYDELTARGFNNKLNLEALIVTETFGHSPAAANDNLIGGGSGGGGGASGNY